RTLSRLPVAHISCPRDTSPSLPTQFLHLYTSTLSTDLPQAAFVGLRVTPTCHIRVVAEETCRASLMSLTALHNGRSPGLAARRGGRA
ncbi:hypothetical protein J6590_100474, partial [Homalodisca vitripennis]